jgi:AmpD protein
MLEERTIIYKPAIGLTADGQADFFWSDNPRPQEIIDTLIIHSMYNPNAEGDEQYSAEACIALLNSLGLSTHYFIDRLGQIFQCVDEVREAWQAGKSKMPHPDNRQVRNSVNAFSVSVELSAKPGDEFTSEQYDSLVWLCCQIMTRLPIEYILGHSHVATAEVRPDPKTDPGEKFDWQLVIKMLADAFAEKKLKVPKRVGDLKIEDSK